MAGEAGTLKWYDTSRPATEAATPMPAASGNWLAADRSQKRAAAAGSEIELDALACDQFVHAVGEHGFADEDVVVARIGREAEALFGVVPLHLSNRHGILL